MPIERTINNRKENISEQTSVLDTTTHFELLACEQNALNSAQRKKGEMTLIYLNLLLMGEPSTLSSSKTSSSLWRCVRL